MSAKLKDQTKAISQMISRLEPIFAVPEDEYKEWISEHETSRRVLDSRPQTSDPTRTEKQLEDIWKNESETRTRVEEAILTSFCFPSLTNRKEEIADTHPETFQWIFSESPSQGDEPPWSNFAYWLQHGNGIFWINGKAASGKSTLMRYICEDQRTLAFLAHWASPEEPTVADFYFWNSGTLEQRSQAGLLRTILFHLLKSNQISVGSASKLAVNVLRQGCTSDAWGCSKFIDLVMLHIKLPISTGYNTFTELREITWSDQMFGQE
jgi:hypothetical protein